MMNGNRNLALHVDYYLPRWMYIYWKENKHNTTVVFDAFYRKNPFNNGYSVFGGTKNIIKYLENLTFDEDKINWLQKQFNFEDEFVEVLRNYKFTGTLYAAEEGEIIFPNVPFLRVEARIFEAKLFQTAMLTIINHETLIATKCSRIVGSVKEYAEIRGLSEEPAILEGGARRAHGIDAAYYGTRMSYIAGFSSTSLSSAAMDFGIPVGGTMEHADIQFAESELEAFRSYANVFPDECVFLVDTYDTLRSGIPNAIKVAKELEAKGYRLKGIRIDSGDLAYLSKRARRMLNEQNLDYVKIIVSGDLDEYVIAALAIQKSEIDTFLIGTKAITAFEQPAFGAVYKIVAKKNGDDYEPLIKISSSLEKMTNPGFKIPYRIIDNETGMFKGDYVALKDENVKALTEIELENVRNPESKNYVTNFEVRELLQPIYIDGKLTYTIPSTDESRANHQTQLNGLWEEYKRKDYPEKYSVTFSDMLTETKKNMMKKKRY